MAWSLLGWINDAPIEDAGCADENEFTAEGNGCVHCGALERRWISGRELDFYNQTCVSSCGEALYMTPRSLKPKE